MAVPSSGELKLWDTLWNDELGGSKGDNSLHSASVYAGFDTPDALSDFYGWSDVEVPTVTTYTATNVTDNSMCARVCVNTTGNEDPTYGVYFGTNSSSHTNNTKYTIGTGGVGLYCSYRTGLNYLTTYYWWGFACNSAGEAVGNRCSASTPAPTYTPTFSALSCAFSRTATFGNNDWVCSCSTQQYRNPYTLTHTVNRSCNRATGTDRVYTCFNGQNVVTNGLNLYQNRSYQPQAPTQGKCAGVQVGQPSGLTFSCGGGHGSNPQNTSRCIVRHNSGTATNVAAGIYYCFSDIRFKTNITYL